MSQSTEKPISWFVKRCCEALLILLVFMAGVVTHEMWPQFNFTDVPGTSGQSQESIDKQQGGGAEMASAEEPVDYFQGSSIVSVQRTLIPLTISMKGQVSLDPSRVKEVSAAFAGRIDRLYVGSVGLHVEQKEPLARIFSAELMESQKDLIDAVIAYKERNSQSTGFLGQLQARQVEAARDGLRQMGLSSFQIEEIEKFTTPREYLRVYAPVSGRLIESHVYEGQYVTKGDPLFKVADLSQVYVTLGARQDDLRWLRYGQQVRFKVEGQAEEYQGLVAVLGVQAQPPEHLWNVQVVVENSLEQLRPGMSVQAEVDCMALASGVVVDPNLAGHWLCPVHPHVVSETSGYCELCKRTLVSAEQFGYLGLDPNAELPLVVPSNAVFFGSKGQGPMVRKQVGQDPNQEFIAIPVMLAGEIGDNFVVEEGLAEGDLVCVREPGNLRGQTFP